MIRPGPDRLAPGLCPGGIISHVYAVPSGWLISASMVVAGNVEQVGTMDAERAAEAETVCLVFFDGDTGERMQWPGHATGDRLVP